MKKNVLWLAVQKCLILISFPFEVLLVFVGGVSLFFGLFQRYPKFTLPFLIQIYLPWSLFGRFLLWVYYRVLSFARAKHTHLIASTGSGKSYLLLYLIYRDILEGYGVLVIEPHSQLIEQILHLKILQLNHKKQFYKKLVYLDFESKNPPPLNLFSVPLPKNEQKREIYIHSLVQNYLQAFEKAFEFPQGARRMLKNCLLALFEIPDSTLLDLLEMLQSKKFLNPKFSRLFQNLKNPILKKYFESDFFTHRSEFSKEALRIRIEHLLIDRQVRLIFRQKENVLNVKEVLQKGKIVLVRAGQSIGAETSKFLGALVHQLVLHGAMLRVNQEFKKPFSIFLDECQNYMSDDVSKGLDEARKAGIQYVLAHQRLHQRGMSQDEQKALNACAVKIYGKLEYDDALKLSRQVLMNNQPDRFVNLRVGEFFVKVGFFKTRFLKFPRYFAPRPEKIGKIRHSLFALNDEVKRLLAYLKPTP